MSFISKYVGDIKEDDEKNYYNAPDGQDLMKQFQLIVIGNNLIIFLGKFKRFAVNNLIISSTKYRNA